jgi:beta-lactamase regulating signal transducer with metallopeptidase domain
MSLDLLFDLAWRSTACAALALLALRLLRGRSAAEQSHVAHLGLLATLVAPLAAFALPPVTLPAAASALQAPAPVTALFAAEPAAPVALAGAGFAGGGPSASAFEVAAVAPWLYLAPALVLGLGFAVRLARLQQLRARARVLVDGAWLIALAAAQERLRFKHGAALLLVSAELSSPVSWGVLRPVIIVDEATATREAEAEAIIAHELAHLARWDWAKLLCGAAATAVFWFNPLVWMLARRCHDLREEAADDAVLAGPVPAHDYAELLVRCARAERRAVFAANGVSPSRGSIARRVGRVLDPGRRGAPARANWTLGAAAAGLVFAAPFAITFTAPAGVQVTRAQGARASTPPPVVRSASARAAAPLSSQGAPMRVEAAAAAAAVTAAAPFVQTAGPSPVLDEALVKAAGQGDVATVRELLGSGVSPNAAVRGDGSPLIQAARAGRADMVRLLLDRGASIDMAVEGDGNPLIMAAAGGRSDMVRLLLDAGADVNASTASDETALIQASGRGHDEVVRLLLSRGAEVNAQVGPRTALRMARTGGHADVERLLLEAGAAR